MKLQDVYEAETGKKALYRRDSSDYHTLQYVRWLEDKVVEVIAERDTLESTMLGLNALVFRLRAQVEELKETIKGALRIQSCWLPPPNTVDAEHAGEAQALYLMLDRFKAALSGEGE